MDLQAFESRIHSEIPLSRHMGVKVVSASPQEVVLAAPLAPNINHKRTAFGGSLHALAVLAGWSVVTATLMEQRAGVGYLVIQESEIDYLKPVDGDFTARAQWPEGGTRTRFLEGIRRKGVARAQVDVEVLCKGQVCARLKGKFVAEAD